MQSRPVSPMPKLLILAYACSPERGSEGGVGWNRAEQASRSCDTWVLCQGGPMREEIERRICREDTPSNLHFEFIEKTSLVQLLMRFPGLYYMGLWLWHRQAYRAARRLHERVHFDLAHLVNLATFREPGYLWKLGIPHIWGPWGGTQNFPWRFLPVAGFTGAVVEAARTVVNQLQFRFGSRMSRAAAAGPVLVTHSQAQRDYKRVHGQNAELVPCNGIRRVEERGRTWTAANRPLRVLWCGELRPIKGFPLLLRALAKLPTENRCEVRVLGRGRSEKSWKRTAEKLGVAGCITWCGWLPHAQALEQYAWADLFVFTSLRDSFPTVILEALAAGLPVICLDHQGMSDMVTELCGVKIPVTNPERVATELAQELTSLSHDSERWSAMSHEAILQARKYLWSRLGAQMAELYASVLKGKSIQGEPLHPAANAMPVGAV